MRDQNRHSSPDFHPERTHLAAFVCLDIFALRYELAIARRALDADTRAERLPGYWFRESLAMTARRAADRSQKRTDNPSLYLLLSGMQGSGRYLASPEGRQSADSWRRHLGVTEREFPGMAFYTGLDDSHLADLQKSLSTDIPKFARVGDLDALAEDPKHALLRAHTYADKKVAHSATPVSVVHSADDDELVDEPVVAFHLTQFELRDMDAVVDLLEAAATPVATYYGCGWVIRNQAELLAELGA